MRFDEEAIERLKKMGGEGLANKMVALFLETSLQRLEEAQEAHKKGEPLSLANAVHPLKSSSAYVGADQVGAVSGRIEEEIRRGQTDDLDGLLSELETEIKEAHRHLEEIKGDRWG